MNGYLMIILAIGQILPLCVSAPVSNQSSMEDIPKDENLIRRRLSMFPKLTKHYVVSATPPSTMRYVHTPKHSIMPKISIPVQIPPKHKSETLLTTRTPLMSMRIFTLKLNKNMDAVKRMQDVKISSKEGQNLQTRALHEDIVNVPEKNQDVKRISRSSLSKDYIQQDVQDPDELEDEMYRFALEQDDREYIFVHKYDQDLLAFDLSDDDNRDYYIDGTNAVKTARAKRSENIIEEENLASTISASKFTGRETRLNNNFYFKNINS